LPKRFALDATEIEMLATGYGACLASDRIMVDGKQVGFMYREKGDNDLDSGWRFLAGDESEEYLANAQNVGLYDVNTVANYDPSIIQYLGAPVGSAYSREGSGELRPVNQ
jgi:hypothetical protein